MESNQNMAELNKNTRELSQAEVENVSGGNCKCWCKQYSDSVVKLDSGWASNPGDCNNVCYSHGLLYADCN